jgi:hypothetical protein
MTDVHEFPPHHGRTGPQHRVYVIEVEVVDPQIAWTLYVGYTNLYLRERWIRYEQRADSVSRYFRDGRVIPVRYRYDLTKGWGPYATRDEGVRAEGDLALALEQAGFAVYSDQLKVARSRWDAPS